jgi:hypothetical protein
MSTPENFYPNKPRESNPPPTPPNTPDVSRPNTPAPSSRR